MNRLGVDFIGIFKPSDAARVGLKGEIPIENQLQIITEAYTQGPVGAIT